MPEETNSLPSSLPEVHYDLVVRVIPGMFVAAGIYSVYPQLFVGSFNYVSLLILAYMCGLFLETVSDRVCDQKVRMKFLKDQRWMGEIWDFWCYDTSPRRASALKILAERAMCRSLVLLSAFSCLYSLFWKLVPCAPKMPSLPEWWHMPLLLVLSFMAFLRFNTFIHRITKDAEKKPNGK